MAEDDQKKETPAHVTKGARGEVISNADNATKRAVYTPPELPYYGTQAIRHLQDKAVREISIGIPGLLDYVPPVRAGQICAVIAQTSQYKSGFLHCIERNAANQLAKEGRLDEALVHVSVEETLEEQAFLEIARESGIEPIKLARGDVDSWERVNDAGTKIATRPLYYVGDSIARSEDLPELHMDNVFRALQYMSYELHGRPLTIAGIYVDYLQAFPISPKLAGAAHEQQRRLQVRSDVYRLRQMANYFRCPVFVGVQAKQHLDGHLGANMMIPGIYDGEETSSIAQRFDRIIQLWMPKMTHVVGQEIEHGGYRFRVDENLLFIRVGKQRGGLPSGRIWRCRIDFARNQILPEASVLGT